LSLPPVALGLFFGLAVLAAACGEQAPPVPPGSEHVAQVHRARCGSCHRRVEPGERTRGQLDVALVPHRKRVMLTDAEWLLLIDYLAGTNGGPPSAPPAP